VKNEEEKSPSVPLYKRGREKEKYLEKIG